MYTGGKDVIIYEAPAMPSLPGEVIAGEVIIAPIPAPGRRPSDIAIIAGWLAEKKSVRTQKSYQVIMHDFLAHLVVYADARGLAPIDLIEGPRPELYAAALAFLPSSKVAGRVVATSTRNQRVAALRSFYEYAVGMDYCARNPLARLKSENGEKEHAAWPLETAQVKSGMQAIDSSTLAGKRDRAMLSILLTTGRRVSEVRNLTWSKLQPIAGQVKVHFLCKGNKPMEDTLDQVTQRNLEAYRAGLVADLARRGRELAPEMPVFVGLGNRSYGQALSIQSISAICERYLGESRVHATRHTWAVRAEEKGASIYDVSKQLGHSNQAITSVYLEKHRARVNPYAAALADDFGLEG